LLAAFQNSEQWAKTKNSVILSVIHHQKLLEMTSQQNNCKVTEISLHQNSSMKGCYKIFSTWKIIVHRLKKQTGHLNLPQPASSLSALTSAPSFLSDSIWSPFYFYFCTIYPTPAPNNPHLPYRFLTHSTYTHQERDQLLGLFFCPRFYWLSLEVQTVDVYYNYCH
jgi:hypothetical protein